MALLFRHLPLRWIVWAISDRMPCAYRGYITNKGKCARLLNSIYTCKSSQDSVNANRIYAGQTENMRRLIFVFPLDTFLATPITNFDSQTSSSFSMSVPTLLNANYR